MLATFLLASIVPTGSRAATVTYRLDVDNTWGEGTHPGAFPGGAHFSWFGGATHNEQVSFWEVGQPTSPGMTRMAELGGMELLLDEVEVVINAGTAGGKLDWPWWFCPSAISVPSCGALTNEFEIDAAFPLVTLVSMLGPTPDWFVGVSGLPLREDGRWLPQVVVDLRPYDGGTRSANQ